MLKLPVRFNPLKLSRHLDGGSSFIIDIPVAQFKRLNEGLEGDEGEINVRLRFYNHDNHHTGVKGHLSAKFNLKCQRCLMPYRQAISSDFALIFVNDEAAAYALPDEFDPVILGDQGQIHVVDLFEDELILQIPGAPRHQLMSDCIAQGFISQYDEHNNIYEPAQERRSHENPFLKLKETLYNSD